MEKQRQVKILSIIALVLAISAMTLGFAAFSTTLSISSSAAVTPSSDDFKIMMYGFKDSTSLNNFYSTYEMSDSYLSNTSVLATGSTTGHNNGIIDNSTHTVSGLNANFTEPGEFVYYHVIIRNEGKYTAYVDWSNYSVSPNGYEVGAGTTESLVQDVIEDIDLSVHVTDVSGVSMGDDPLAPGEIRIAIFQIKYDDTGARADGPFSVTFPDITVDFSTTDVDLVSFIIDGTTYYAINGMTYGDWLNSEYNTDGYWYNDVMQSYVQLTHSEDMGPSIKYYCDSVTELDEPIEPNDVWINGGEF